MFSKFKCILIFSAQRTFFEEVMVFNQKKCLSWYHKYTNDVGELGIYKRKVQCIFKL